MTQEPYFTTLKDRGALRISGIDKEDFLQGLISNDINLLKEQNSIYACLLSPQGKFLYDMFISMDGDVLDIDCEGGDRVESLAKLLNMYKLRADVEIEILSNRPVYAVIGSDAYGYKDPRHPDMGYRSFEQPDLGEQAFEHWDKHRIALTVPDGSRDMIPQKSTMAEGNIDKLNGISYDKGCYVGQELTARMHYRGLAKKHLRTVTPSDLGLDQFPAFGKIIEKDDKTIGEMRSSCGKQGIALLKDN